MAKIDWSQLPPVKSEEQSGIDWSQLPPEQPPQEPSTLSKLGSEAYEFVTNPAKIGRLTFQGAGAMAGGLAGAPLGGVGAFVGAPLGFAIGDQLADIVWGERLPPEKAGKVSAQLKQAAGDVLEGVKYEILGKGMELGGKALYGLEKAAPEMAKRALKGEPILGIKKKATELYEKGAEWVGQYAEKQAAGRIEGMRSKTPGIQAQVPINVKEAERLEKAIPGFKFNLGQTTGDPNLLSLSRAKSLQPGTGTALSQEQIMAQNEALSQYIDTHIIKGGDVGDFLSNVGRIQKNLETATSATKGLAEKEAGGLAGKEADVVGRELLGKARTQKIADTKTAEGLYAQVPDELKIKTQPLSDKIDELFGSFDELTQRLGTMPTGPMSRVKEAMAPKLTSKQQMLIEDIQKMKESGAYKASMLSKQDQAMLKEIEGLPKELTFKQLRDFRSQIDYAKRAAVAKGDYELAYNLSQLKYGVNDTFSVAAESGTGLGVQSLKKATDYWKNVFVPKYRHGATSKILSIKQTREQLVGDSMIGAQYFKPGDGAEEAAASFKKTFGSDPEARQLITDYASQSLLKAGRNPVTGELESRRIATWLSNHATALERHGIRGEFSSLEKAMVWADKAKSMESEFNSQALAKALNVNPEQAISRALFSGVPRRDATRQLQNLAKLSALDKTGAATAGLKSAIGDHFNRMIRVTAMDVSKNKLASYAKIDKFMTEFKPALKQSGLYSKQELQAFDNIHSAWKIVSQQQRPHPEYGGSSTMEIMTRILSSAVSIQVGHMAAYGATNAVFKLMERPIRSKIDAALVRATFDPRYASNIQQLLMDVVKMPVEQAEKRFTERLTMLGAMTLGETRKQQE